MLALADCTLDEEILGFNMAGFKSHIFLAICGKLKQKYIKSFWLPVKCNSVDARIFQFKIKLAIRSYKVDCTVD